MKNNFAVFILTHKRADKIITLKTLEKSGYNGMIYILIDNEDATVNEYIKKHKNVIVFDKKMIADKFDEGDNFNDRRTIQHARNYAFELAKEKNIDYFIELDDDYTQFVYKIDSKLNYQEKNIKNIEPIWDSMIDFLKVDKRIKTIAMAQNGDFLGGKDSGTFLKMTLKRKAMNSFILNKDSDLRFDCGRMNEDVNTYTTHGKIGELFFTVPFVALIQKQTQSNSGGITEMYLDFGTYVKSFFSVMYNPSFISVRLMGYRKPRIHHHIDWKFAVPCILEETYKK